MIPPPRWTTAELSADLAEAEERFRAERLREPLEQYLAAFDAGQGDFEDLLELTVDLSRLEESALEILTNPRRQEAFRYLAGPPYSADDLRVVAQAGLTARTLRAEPAAVPRVVGTVLMALDRRRFPWVAENREPTELERNAALVASAALLATRNLETARRTEGKNSQEKLVEEALLAAGLGLVQRRHVQNMHQAPGAGELCLESKLGTRKADLIVTLWDGRLMPIEAKVSNSATNSVKRLNNDAAAKAETWRKDFGERQIVPVAVLSGVYKLHNLEEAQTRGLTLFWAHKLDALIEWVRSTRQ